MMSVLLTAVVLLAASLTAAQENHIRNLEVDQNSTHVTFSWDIVDGYYSSSYISSFYLYYQYGSTTRALYISYRSTTWNINTNGSTTFIYTRVLENFNEEEYIMWVAVHRNGRLDPNVVNSAKQYVILDFPVQEIILEFKIHFWPTQTCSDFIGTSTYISTQVRSEVFWILFKSCQCALPYDFTVEDGYFTCASGYVIYRARLSTSDNFTLDLTFLKNRLTNWLLGEDENRAISLNGKGYFIGPGPCGLTIQDLYAAHCVSLVEALDFNQDNTTIIVTSALASMFFILSLALIGYICVLSRKAALNLPREAARETAMTKAHGTEPTCADRQWEDPRYYPEPEQIYAEMDGF